MPEPAAPPHGRSLFDAVVVRYGELALKGGNRALFENVLLRNMREAAEREGAPARIVKTRGRFDAWPNDPAASPKLIDALRRVFGIASLSPAIRAGTALEALGEGATRIVEAALAREPGDARVPFRVDARRADKSYPLKSAEINAQVGGILLGRFPRLAVDLERPRVSVGLEIRPHGEAFLFEERVPGPGGLPLGTTGKVVALLSAGIDSPVAAWLAMKRGCRVALCHFHSFPFLGRESEEKVRDLARILARWQPRTALWLVPLAEIQKAVKLAAPEPYRTLLYRRAMHRLAERVAAEERARAIVTGDNLGQVASQTLENLLVTERASRMLLLRPLLTYDKSETIALAREIGTFETSIRPADDCCTLFQPKSPAIHGRVDEAERAEELVPGYAHLLDDAYSRATTETV